ncbi:MAG: histidinol dehydrogenase, partial [Anaerolineales bacterium]|nr:histidinol dehydrogenase [Anaerolineales bacterium]
MISIYDKTTALKTILNRDNALDMEIPESLQQGITAMFGEPLTPEQVVRRILNDVRQRGDAALKEWSRRIDRVELEAITIPQAEITAGAKRIPADLYEALELAANRIRTFHECQPLPNWTTDKLGGTLGQRATPIEKVGVYVPGGTAPLPSSLLMSVIPAQVAGVSQIVVATPPGRGETIYPNDAILAAAHIAGIDTIYLLGGAQAVGALAFGTESVLKVDKIVGAGNLFVTLAKREVYGRVGIDGLYGPTETVVVADDTADAAWVAADMLAQAEHDVLATAILLTPSQQLAEAVQVEI